MASWVGVLFSNGGNVLELDGCGAGLTLQVLNASDLLTLQWLILCHVNFLTTCKTKHSIKNWLPVFLRLPKESMAQQEDKIPDLKVSTMTWPLLPLAQLKMLALSRCYSNFPGIPEHPKA